jgi:hypothetical protein
VSDDELSANAPVDEIAEAKTARHQRNADHATLLRELAEALPTRNLQEALDAVATRQYRTPEEANQRDQSTWSLYAS